MKKNLTYASSGVKYDAMDPFKRLAQMAGRETSKNLTRMGFRELEMSRGESAYLIETPDSYLAHVEEGLGTKNLVADAMYKLTGKSYYDQIAQDAVAMIVNDMITLGALPLSVAMHLAVGTSDWFRNEKRSQDLIRGWQNACNLAGGTWGGGETPTLKDIIMPETCVLSGSAMGIIKPKERLITPENIRHHDAIIFLTSSGIHANGLTLAREIATKLPAGYLTIINAGKTYGEALLEPTHIYVPFIEECLNLGVKIHYGVNITGHGHRKLMRAKQLLTYVIEELPPPLPIFDFIQRHGRVDDREMYGTFNMGAGFALYIPQSDVPKIQKVYEWGNYPFGWMRAGYIYSSKEKNVLIKPKDCLVYSELGIR